MNLRFATWNMRGEGPLTPARLVDLILDPINMGTAAAATGSKKRKGAPVEPIDLIALQEFPLATGAGSYHSRLVAELASRVTTANYRVSPVCPSITYPTQTVAHIFYDELGRRGIGGVRALERKYVRIKQTGTGKSDAYAFVYDSTKIAGFTFPEHSTDQHKTSRYTVTLAGRQIARGALNALMVSTKRVENGQAVFSDSLTEALFLHRPIYATCNNGPVTLQLYSWHAPEEGMFLAGSAVTRHAAYEAIRLFKAFNFSNIPGGLAVAEAHGDLVLVLGDFNADRADIDIIPAPGLRAHLSNGLDHILLGGAAGLKLTLVSGIYNVVTAGYSDHPLVVADLSGTPHRVPAGSALSAAPLVITPAAASSATTTASTSTASTSTASTSTAAPSSTASTSAGGVGAGSPATPLPSAKKSRTGASPAPARRRTTKAAKKK